MDQLICIQISNQYLNAPLCEIFLLSITIKRSRLLLSIYKNLTIWPVFKWLSVQDYFLSFEYRTSLVFGCFLYFFLYWYSPRKCAHCRYCWNPRAMDYLCSSSRGNSCYLRRNLARKCFDFRTANGHANNGLNFFGNTTRGEGGINIFVSFWKSQICVLYNHQIQILVLDCFTKLTKISPYCGSPILPPFTPIEIVKNDVICQWPLTK